MLDTLLEIGSKLRKSEDGLRHHRYIKKPPLGDEKSPVSFWKVPVKADYSFDFSQIQLLKDETRKAQLFYLNFKNGEADSSKPYVFGDIFRLYVRKEKTKRDGKTEIEVSETGNFMFGDPTKGSWSAINSFLRFKDGYAELEQAADETSGKGKNKKAPAPANPLLSQGILAFRNSFRQQLPQILDFLSENPRSYIHFDFSGKGWWELEDKNAIERMMLENFVVSAKNGFVFKAYVYKTIISAEKYGWRSTPGCKPENDYKIRVFQHEEILDLLYALKFAGHSAVPRVGNIKIVVLPRGDNLTSRQIERFFERSGLSAEEESEDQLERETQAEVDKANAEAETTNFTAIDNGFDPTFGMLPADEKVDANILQFDFIFSDGGGKQDIDLIEISGLQRSKLYNVARRVRYIAEDIKPQRDRFIPEARHFVREQVRDKNVAARLNKQLKQMEQTPPQLAESFLNILGGHSKAQTKYQSHLLKVLPQIYTATYFDDPVLLPAFIEKIEFNIRNAEGLGYNLLKWDFYFLSQIQNYEGNRLMDIQKSQSYRVGLLLGHLARGLRSKINSFDKNYAGLISRRISNKEDVMHLHNEINQKLIMHDRAGLAFKVSPQLSEALREFKGQYNKDECAFGFFESYFAPYKPQEEDNETETPQDQHITAGTES